MKKIFLLITLTLFFQSCKVETNYTHKGADDIAGVYKVFMGKIDSLEIYIVDGNLVRNAIYSDFIFGGNEQRYTFIPHNEIWIDNSIPNREYTTTLKHEIKEMSLMRDLGLTYIEAHDSSLMLEVKLRNEFRNQAVSHEKSLPEVSPTDTDSLKQIPALPDKIKLKDIYLEERESKGNESAVWLVDGDKVRREIFPDFGFNGDWNDYNFIPENEIWVDGNISCEEYIYSLIEEKSMIELLNADTDYYEALKKTKEKVEAFRIKIYYDIAKKYVKLERGKELYRDKGVK